MGVSLLLVQCNGNRTPKKYLSQTVAPKSVYTRDSIYLKKVAWHIFKNHLGGFNGTSYDKYTKFYLDTIVYSPDLNKIVFWIITEDSTYKVSRMEEDLKHPSMCYNGCYMFAFRKALNDTLLIYDSFFYMTVFNQNYKKAHDILYEECFNNRYSNTPGYSHNYDDIRVWKQNYWDKNGISTVWYIGDKGFEKIKNY